MHIGLLIIQEENPEKDSLRSELASEIYKKQDFVPILLTSQQGIFHKDALLKTSSLKQKLMKKRVMEYDIFEQNNAVDTYSQVVLANIHVQETNPENIGVLGSELFTNIANKIYPSFRKFHHIKVADESSSFKDKIKEKILFHTLEKSWHVKDGDVQAHEKALRNYHPSLGVNPKKDLYYLLKNT